MVDFDVQKFTRICAKTEHEFKPGESFFAYLVRDGAETVRRDISHDAWEGPPEGCIAWWKSSVPDLHSKKMNWAPDDVMLHYFQETEDKPEQQDVRYLLTLLFVRRRLFRLIDTIQEEDSEALLVTCARNESEYAVGVVDVAPERAVEIQSLLSQLMVDVSSGNAERS